MRVATYTRISTDEAHQPYSLEAQAERLAAYIASQDGWTLAREYSDQKSGATLDRPGLRQALREAQAGRFDLLLVYRVDRLARSTRGLAHVLEELDQAGAVFRSATEPFETATAAGRMMVQMSACSPSSNAPRSSIASWPGWNVRRRVAAGPVAARRTATTSKTARSR